MYRLSECYRKGYLPKWNSVVFQFIIYGFNCTKGANDFLGSTFIFFTTASNPRRISGFTRCLELDKLGTLTPTVYAFLYAMDPFCNVCSFEGNSPEVFCIHDVPKFKELSSAHSKKERINAKNMGSFSGRTENYNIEAKYEYKGKTIASARLTTPTIKIH